MKKHIIHMNVKLRLIVEMQVLSSLEKDDLDLSARTNI